MCPECKCCVKHTYQAQHNHYIQWQYQRNVYTAELIQAVAITNDDLIMHWGVISELNKRIIYTSLARTTKSCIFPNSWILRHYDGHIMPHKFFMCVKLWLHFLSGWRNKTNFWNPAHIEGYLKPKCKNDDFHLRNHCMQLVTSSNDMMLIKLFAFFLLFKNSEACARSSLDNIFIVSITPHFRHQSIPYKWSVPSHTDHPLCRLVSQ
jgi:hypothetical protein